MDHENHSTMIMGAAATAARAQAPHPDSGDVVDFSDPRLYINRELSWLAFNERVLDAGANDTHPLLERVKFLAIAANNLDEFFMIRVATLTRQHAAGLARALAGRPDRRAAADRRAGARGPHARGIASCWDDELRPLLAAAGIHFLDAPHYTPEVIGVSGTYFSANVSPVLTPLAFDPGHPFPYISNRSKSFAVVVEDQGDDEVRAREGAGRPAALHPDSAGAVRPRRARRSRFSKTSCG